MKKTFCYIILLIAVFKLPAQTNMDTITIEEVKVSASIKTDEDLQKATSSINSYNQQYLNNHNVQDFKDFSSQAPTLFIPDYGSKITSSIYLRGLGSRIDNSSVGVCLDGVMLLNKNVFDFTYFDLAKVDIYKGAQSSIFGMNTMAGVISLTTLSPFNYQGIKASLGYSSGNTINASVSYYDKLSSHWAYMTGVDFTSTDGYFDNAYDNSNVDWGRTVNGRIIFEYRKDNIWAKNSTYISYVHQGGYPYALFDTITGHVDEVNYNDFSGYDRFNLIDNFSYIYKNKGKFSFQSLTSVQLNFDKMQMDNDFTPLAYFTLKQKENDYGFSQEFIFKDDNKEDNWNWLFGAFVFYKYLDMDAPVLFKKDGLQALILNNANNGIHQVGFQNDIVFKEDEMLVSDNFKYPRFGGALYTQIDYTLNQWNFSLGLRLDYEYVALDYTTRAGINYKWEPYVSSWRYILTEFKGDDNKNYLQFLPKLAVSYNLKKGIVYASVSKGYMTGGYNTSMFADIIRNQMMQDMLSDMGITPQQGSAMEDIYASYNKNDIIKYKPQYIWNYEIGSKCSLFDNRLDLNVSLFYIDVENQQITIFLTPQTTGRMMTNAAKSRSFGGEVSLFARFNNFNIGVNYGYTNAKFTSYYDGKTNYKDKYLNYYPINTFSITADYLWRLDNRYLDNVNFSLTYNGSGDIYYNQLNTIKQDFYSLLGADVTLKRSYYSISFWARNILDTKYNTFYFLSSGNNFVQKGKPFTLGITLRINR